MPPLPLSKAIIWDEILTKVSVNKSTHETPFSSTSDHFVSSHSVLLIHVRSMHDSKRPLFLAQIANFEQCNFLGV